MKKIRIVTDSSCDLNKDIVEKYNIEIVPLNVAFGDDIYTDGEIEKDEFYEYDIHHNNYYGVPKKLLNEKIKGGKVIIKDGLALLQKDSR